MYHYRKVKATREHAKSTLGARDIHFFYMDHGKEVLMAQCVSQTIATLSKKYLWKLYF